MREKLIGWLEKTLALFMTLLVLDGIWQGSTRLLLKNQSAVTDELARFLLIWLGLLGAALVSGHKMHLAIDLLSDRISNPRSQKYLAILSNL